MPYMMSHKDGTRYLTHRIPQPTDSQQDIEQKAKRHQTHCI